MVSLPSCFVSMLNVVTVPSSAKVGAQPIFEVRPVFLARVWRARHTNAIRRSALLHLPQMLVAAHFVDA
jgi:hypothetical protein